MQVQRGQLQSHLQSAMEDHLNLACAELNNAQAELIDTQAKLNDAHVELDQALEQLNAKKEELEAARQGCCLGEILGCPLGKSLQN